MSVSFREAEVWNCNLIKDRACCLERPEKTQDTPTLRWKKVDKSYSILRIIKDCHRFQDLVVLLTFKNKSLRNSPPPCSFLNDAKDTNWCMLGKMDLQKFPAAMGAWRFFIQILGEVVVINHVQSISHKFQLMSLGILQTLHVCADLNHQVLQ